LSPENNPIVREFAMCDAEGEVCEDPDVEECRFLSVSADCDVVSVGERSVVASSVKGVGEKLIMWYTPKWLETYYTLPLKNVSIYHCLHCTGVESPCACQLECDRPAKSRCDVLRSYEHAAWCDGCRDQRYIVGAMYKCTVCANFDLCRVCYFERGVDYLTHPYEEISTPGATPRRLAPRKAKVPEIKAPPPPPPPVSFQSQSIKDIKDLVWGRSSAPLSSSSSSSSYSNSGLIAPSATFGSSTPSAKAKVPFTKDDMVVLKGLTKGEMNGKEATVLSVDVAAQKVQIQIVGMEKTFKVKWENVELVGDLEDVEEELE